MEACMRILVIVLAASALVGSPAFASSAEGEHREHDAHVHGVAAMNLVVDGRELVLELETPAMNILGFEHAPRNDAEHRAVEEAAASLERAEEWLVPSPGAGCRLETARVESALLEHNDHAEGEEHGDQEEYENEDKHAHGEDHDEAHTEFHVSYVFHCDYPAELDTLQVNWFGGFPGMEKIEVQAVTESRQIGGELTPDQTVIKLKE
jgi:hypothetical protein